MPNRISSELLFETSNKMEGVPFSDSFTVDTKWRVAQEGDKTRMKVWVRVDFKKSVSFIKGNLNFNLICIYYFYTRSNNNINLNNRKN